MPELPEVQTVVNGLSSYIVGAKIAGVSITLERIAQPSADILRSALPGRRITACTRRAKYIVMHLDDGSFLIVHLRMTGRLVYVAADKIIPEALRGQLQATTDDAPRYCHLTLAFENGARLHFADARTFGRVRLIAPAEQWDAALGAEPLDPDFALADFAKLLKSRRGPIKNVLLDQKLVVGIGNIYACEALWQAGISPHKPARDLKRDAVSRLYEAIRDVLTRSIAMRGTSARDYVDAEGLKGGFQNVLAVYGRHGQPCKNCGTEIQRVVIAQRGTWYCARCQSASRQPAGARGPTLRANPAAVPKLRKASAG